MKKVRTKSNNKFADVKGKGASWVSTQSVDVPQDTWDYCTEDEDIMHIMHEQINFNGCTLEKLMHNNQQ